MYQYNLFNKINFGDFESVKRIIEKDPSLIDEQSYWDNDLLSCWLDSKYYRENNPLTLYLLKKGVNTEHRNKQGHTALHLAMYHSRLSVVKLLINGKHQSSYAGKMPLDYGFNVGDDQLFKYLIKQGYHCEQDYKREMSIILYFRYVQDKRKKRISLPFLICLDLFIY